MTVRRKITEAQARATIAEHGTIAAAARALGVSGHTVRGVIDPEYAERGRERDRKYREANREAVLERHRKYREANREAIRERNRNTLRNPEDKREYDRKYREANREAVLERRRELARSRHAANPEVARVRVRKYYAANREVMLERHRARRAAARNQKAPTE